MDTTSAKRQAAAAAARLLPERGIIGLGSGSTAAYFIEEVGKLIAKGHSLFGVPTSEESRSLAVRHGIPLLSDSGEWEVDLCVDGADEVSDALDLIKGGGGCHTREKIVNAAARQNVVVVDESKLSRKLGERWPVPLEVLEFGAQSTCRLLAKFGQVSVRQRDGGTWRSDAGNLIVDVRVGPIADPAALDQQLRAVPGVVETGLFVRRVDRVLVSGPGGVRELSR